MDAGKRMLIVRGPNATLPTQMAQKEKPMQGWQE